MKTAQVVRVDVVIPILVNTVEDVPQIVAPLVDSSVIAKELSIMADFARYLYGTVQII